MQVTHTYKYCLHNKNLLRYYCKTTKSSKYKDTVLLPKTKFPQRLTSHKLQEQTKNIYKSAGFADLYSWQSSRNGNEFVLHDGPPYANGKPHMGHMINKILKDVINRHQIIKGNKIHYVPGWDCHGLPIELKALQKTKKKDMSAIDIRTTARKFADETIKEQRNVFESWGVMGNWNNSYCTYTIPYVKNQLKQFYKLYEKNLVYRDYKPVYWSPSSCTALAEAELQYNENHESTSIILKLKLSQIPELLKPYKTDIYALIWTTTPWTLPSNQAICYNPNISYSLIKSDDNEVYIVATELINEVSKSLKTKFDVLISFIGDMLKYGKYQHLFSNETLPFLPGSHATATKGTGLVHTAPAHGPDDFLLALNHKIPVKCIVDEHGKYTNEAGSLKGLYVLSDGNERVLEMLNESILCVDKYVHSYPYDWRTKKPVILRASQQWFIDTNSLKEKAVKALEDVQIVPERNNEIYKQTLITQVMKRPYWCISRQRVWGVPIPVFYSGKKTLISCQSIDHLCDLIDKHGTDFWWRLPTTDLVSPDLSKTTDIASIEKGTDIFDIWFDSGISWSYVLNNKTADMYLEGIDQFNGWFQSSLMTSVALQNKAPYKKIFVHGFAVDENGLKMSKSIGNVVDPQELINGSKKQPALGVDTLRWWVACHASTGSTAFVSPNVLQSSQDEVQKIRNTLRFAVAGLNDYDTNDTKTLNTIDKYLLHLSYEFDLQTKLFYNEYQFNKLGIYIVNFITNPVSALYYSIIKDRLYCNKVTDSERRGCQFVLNVLLQTICKAIAPITPHLVEEVWLYRTNEKNSFFKTKMSDRCDEWNQPKVKESVETVLDIKKFLNKEYKTTLDLNVDIRVGNEVYKKLQIFDGINELLDILQFAEVTIKKDDTIDSNLYEIKVTTSKNVLCERCKRYNSLSTDCLCSRCSNVIETINKLETVA